VPQKNDLLPDYMFKHIICVVVAVRAGEDDYTYLHEISRISKSSIRGLERIWAAISWLN
jgi:hypothetical protein